MAKKKANPQSDNNKHPKTQHETPVDDAASEKLHNLQSLNSLLLKETVERRQQVDSLTQANSSLESELNRCVSELNGLTEQAVKMEIEKGVASRYVAVQVFEMAEVYRNDKVAMVEKIGNLERDLKRVINEKIAIERLKNLKDSEIDSLNRRLNTLDGEIGEEKFILSRVSEERDAIRAQIEGRIQIENVLRSKLAESEKNQTVIMETSQNFKVDYDRLVKEKSSIEAKLGSILKEKDSIEKNLLKSNELINNMKIDMNKTNKQKMVIEEDRDLQEKKINGLQDSVNNLNESVQKLQREKTHLLNKVAELEKQCVASLDNEANMRTKVNILMKEKQKIESDLQRVNEEKSLAAKDLDDALNSLRKQNLNIGQLVHEKKKINDLVNNLNESVQKLQQEKTQLLNKVAELEKKCVVSLDNEANTRTKVDILVKEKQEIEADLQRVNEEKSLVAKDLDDALNSLRKQNLNMGQLVHEKTKINDAKNQADTDIIKLKQQLEELENTVEKLEKHCIVQTDKIKQLEAENNRHVAAYNQATKERSNAISNLDGEKQKVKLLSDTITKMENNIQDMQKKLSKMQKETEKLVAEKKDLENTRKVLENDIQTVKKSLAKTQTEHDNTKGKLKVSEANTKQILKILKKTSSICNSNKDGDMGIDQETEFVEEIKHHVREIEAIKKAFKDKASVMDEMKKQVEQLKVHVVKADKGKSFWTMVSSATTVLAAMSLAYVARGGY